MRLPKTHSTLNSVSPSFLMVNFLKHKTRLPQSQHSYMSVIDKKKILWIKTYNNNKLKGHSNPKQSYKVKRASELLHPNPICFHLFKLLLMFSLLQPLICSLIPPSAYWEIMKQKSTDSWFKLNASYLFKKPKQKTQNPLKTKNAHQNNTKSTPHTQKEDAHCKYRSGELNISNSMKLMTSKAREETEFTWKAFQTTHLTMDAGMPLSEHSFQQENSPSLKLVLQLSAISKDNFASVNWACIRNIFIWMTQYRNKGVLPQCGCSGLFPKSYTALQRTSRVNFIENLAALILIQKPGTNSNYCHFILFCWRTHKEPIQGQ